jgi:hypothetical protein
MRSPRAGVADSGVCVHVQAFGVATGKFVAGDLLESGQVGGCVGRVGARHVQPGLQARGGAE